MAKPGKTATQGAISIYSLPWCNIPPHDGDGGCIDGYTLHDNICYYLEDVEVLNNFIPSWIIFFFG